MLAFRSTNPLHTYLHDPANVPHSPWNNPRHVPLLVRPLRYILHSHTVRFARPCLPVRQHHGIVPLLQSLDLRPHRVLVHVLLGTGGGEDLVECKLALVRHLDDVAV